MEEYVITSSWRGVLTFFLGSVLLVLQPVQVSCTTEVDEEPMELLLMSPGEVAKQQ